MAKVPPHGHTKYATDDWLRRTRAALQEADAALDARVTALEAAEPIPGPQGEPGPPGPEGLPGPKGDPGAVFVDGIARPLHVWADGTVRVHPETDTEPEPEPEPDPTYDAVFTGDATGASDVTAALKAFLQAHAGHHVALAANGVYRVTLLQFTVRDLTLDFRGARLVGSQRGAHGILRLQTCTDVTLNDPEVHGTGYAWDWADQSEHGIHIDGGSGIVVNRPVTRDTRGDGIYVGYQAGKNQPSTGVVIRDVDIQRASRNGISPVAGEVSIIGGAIVRSGLHSIDFEPNNDQGAQSIRGVVDGVDVRQYGDIPGIELSSYAIAAGGYSTATKPSMLVQNVTGDVLRMTIRDTAVATVRDNVSDQPAVVDFRDCGSVTFTGNTRITRA